MPYCCDKIVSVFVSKKKNSIRTILCDITSLSTAAAVVATSLLFVYSSVILVVYHEYNHFVILYP